MVFLRISTNSQYGSYAYGQRILQYETYRWWGYLDRQGRKKDENGGMWNIAEEIQNFAWKKESILPSLCPD